MKLANLVVKNQVGANQVGPDADPQAQATFTRSSFYEPLGVIAQEYYVASQLASSLARLYVLQKVNYFINPTRTKSLNESFNYTRMFESN